MRKKLKYSVIDMDLLFYRFAHKHKDGWEDMEDWEKEETKLTACAEMDNIYKWIVGRADCKKDYCCVSGKDNYRKKIYDKYKINRPKSPELVGILRDHVLDTYDNILCEDKLEADDIIGMVASKNFRDCMICTIDKDLDTIAGYHFNFVKDTFHYTSKRMAREFLYCQFLAGDSTDNFKGIPRVGLKTAKKLLHYNYTWENVVKIYEEKGLTEEDALVTARMAFILRDGWYDKENKEVKIYGGEDV